ncbi:MAG: hypothetical protein AAB922_03380 [Patescibacteria group bacterium]
MPIKIEEITREEYNKKYGELPAAYSVPKEERTGNFLTGLAKSGLSTVKGSLQLGLKGARAILPKGIEPPEDFLSEENLQKNILGFEKHLTEESLQTRGTSEKAGKFVGDVAQFAIPGTKLAKAPLIAKALTSGAIGAAQTGELKGGVIAGVTEALIPGASALMGRLLKGTASGLSGASSKMIDAILSDSKTALKTVKEIKSSGGANLLRKNAEAIVQGVSRVRQEARKAFGEGLEQLKEVDINPTTFRNEVGAVLSKFGSVVKGGVRKLQNIEFDDPKNLKRALELVDKLSRVKLNGVSLRKLADDISSAGYKIATSDERLAFNAFVKELSGGLKNAVSKSTDKLDEINKAFSQDMGLADEIQSIFGKVKFKNAKEILTVSKRLEDLFSQKGLAPESIDKFLTKIGISPSKFRAGEATRQVSELAQKANSVGTSVFELIRSFTAALVPPKAVRDLAIVTGLGQEVAQKVAALPATARGALIRYILGEREPKSPESQE